MKRQSDHIIKVGAVEVPGVIEVSNSRMKKWRQCQYAHDLKYVRKITPKKKGIPLRKGSWIHECLEVRDVGGNWVDVIKRLKKEEYDKLFVEEKAELGDLPTDVFRMMRAYHQTYKLVDSRYETVAVEQDFMIRVPNTNVVLTGIVDKIYRDKETGDIWGMEHKTVGKVLPTEQFRMTDVQTGIYSAVMPTILKKLKLDHTKFAGIIFDYIKTKPPTIPTMLKAGTMSRKKIKCDRYTYTACLKSEGLDPADYEDMLVKLDEEQFFSRIPLVKSKDMMEQLLVEAIITANQIETHSGKSVARSLGFTCDMPKCEYRQLCMAELEGLDVSILIGTQYEEGETDGEERESEPDTGEH